MDYDYTPRMIRKMLHTAVSATSFEQAARDGLELGEYDVSSERIRRLADKIGEERVAQRDAMAERFAALPLPEQRLSPAAVSPCVACVQMDGGRAQIRPRNASDRDPQSGFWREIKVGDLRTFASETSADDPCPELPQTFRHPERMSQIAREIKGFSSTAPLGREAQDEEPEEPKELADKTRRPEPLVLSVVATRAEVHRFGELLAAAAYERGFHAAPRKAFVADGAEANWSVWRKHFSHYTPIVDFVHAVSYVYAAALAGGNPDQGWIVYCDWAQRLWAGQIDHVIAEIEARQRGVGQPEEDEPETSPRAQVAKTLTYLRNQRHRMRYDEYRRQGLPITSSYVESTVKRIHRRVKGTEKFWSTGLEGMLTLAADHLSETHVLDRFWKDRRPPPRRSYQTAA